MRFAPLIAKWGAKVQISGGRDTHRGQREMNYRTVSETLRTHGKAPYCLAVVHGGPGAAGVAKLILVGSGSFRQAYVAKLLEARQSRSDEYDPVEDESEGSLVEFRRDIYDAVWPEAAQLRESGDLLAQASRVRCPVVAIHGDCDPHPWEGVSQPLSEVLPESQFELLRKCGHKPWIERHARDQFYGILESELSCRAGE